jgi:type VI secretion system protein ImpJ
MSQPLPDLPIVAWKEGLHLEPPQYQWLEARVESQLREARAAGLVEPWGVRSLRTWWDGAALGVETIDAVLPSGIRIVVPDADRVDSVPVAAGALDEEGFARIDLAVPRRDAFGVWPSESWAFDTVKAADALSDDPRPGPLAVVRLKARLALEGTAPAGWETMPIARVRRTSPYRDDLELDPEFVPPLLRIGASPTLAARFEQIHRRCRQAAVGLADDLRDVRLSGVGREDSTAETLLKLASINRCIGALQPLVGRGEPHPFEIHRCLSGVIAELAFYMPDRVVPEAPAYDHRRFAEQFAWFSERIDAMVTTRFQPLYDPQELETSDGWRWVCAMDERWPRGGVLLLGLEVQDADADDCARWLREAKVYGERDVAVPQYALNGLRVVPRERELTGLPEGFVFVSIDLAGSEEPRRRALRESPEMVVEMPEPLPGRKLVFFTERPRS